MSDLNGRFRGWSPALVIMVAMGFLGALGPSLYAVIWIGQLSRQIDINTNRLDRIENGMMQLRVDDSAIRERLRALEIMQANGLPRTKEQ